MFDVFCEQHGTRVLLGNSNIQGVNNTDEGIQLRYRCYCGHEGTMLTGRRAA